MLLYVKLFSAMDHQAKWSPSCQDESLLGLSEGGEAENLVFKAVAVPSARFMPDGVAVTVSRGRHTPWRHGQIGALGPIGRMGNRPQGSDRRARP